MLIYTISGFKISGKLRQYFLFKQRSNLQLAVNKVQVGKRQLPSVKTQQQHA
jgi:hypothetical protein